MIVMQGAGKPEQAHSSNEQWLMVAGHLAQLGLRVPKVVEVLPGVGAVVMEDFGDETLAAYLEGSKKEDGQIPPLYALYDSAFGVIGTMLACPVQPGDWRQKAAFDQAKFIQELEFFSLHYLHNLADIRLPAHEAQQLLKDIHGLAGFLSQRCHYGVHRDFHSRNLMVCPTRELGIIDFQDMRAGPASYDMVSLCFDAYVPLSLGQRREILQRGIVKVCGHYGIPSAVVAPSEWQPMLLQRQLKAMGSFAYLAQVKGKKDFLRYIAPASETLGDLFDERWAFLSGAFMEKYVLPSAGRAYAEK
jgi:aminoglycoside/choline kinase family phosphotransferase